MTSYRNNNYRDFSVRPPIRICGALLLVFVSCVFVVAAIPMFHVQSIAPNDCSGRAWKRLYVCYLFNWIGRLIPPHAQGPIEGIAGLLGAGIAIYGAWALLRPLVSKVR